MNHEIQINSPTKKENNIIPIRIAPEGEEVFYETYGVPFKIAQDLAKQGNQKWLDVFTYIYEHRDTTDTRS